MYDLAKSVAAAPDGRQWVTLREASGDTAAVRICLVEISPTSDAAARRALADISHPIEEFARDLQFDAYCRELCRRSIVAWEGIGRAGEAVAVTLENVDALLRYSDVLGQLKAAFIYPYLERLLEKNGSSPSSNGTSPETTGAKDIAPAAPADATPAHTPPKPPKPAKAKPSGK